MTTTVTVLIQGNKACAVQIEEPGMEPREATIVKPGQFVIKGIHGEMSVSVKETGEFLP